ncbi:MAG: hypothetical protein ACOVNW_05190 [Flavobacterium sp.]
MSKRLFLYFFLFSIVSTLSGQCYAASSVSYGTKPLNEVASKSERIQFNESPNIFEFSKCELVNDSDNEENEFEQEFAEKQAVSIDFPKTIGLLFNWIATTTFHPAISHHYYRENSSRLPRYNFISLRVLRL